ncbi:hypothetical protein B0T21DRAFT_348285 [Apiosordaria backusii]|uniref:C2H2-type domain-containing protein n=1 Tax=Apiosordaria backusii TaxID=314023 RepID=A0AA40BL24_9PEZI|nr:hypothetical protein B0T21DRAFT_348285 [Apiosordaria backusii]
MQMYRRQWNCRPCDLSFHAGKDMVSHLKLVHANHWQERQIPAVLEVSETVLDGNQQQACIMCNSTLFISSLMNHLAAHLEQLALFVLPPDDVEGPEAPSPEALSPLDPYDDDEDLHLHDTAAPIIPSQDTPFTEVSLSPAVRPSDLTNPGLGPGTSDWKLGYQTAWQSHVAKLNAEPQPLKSGHDENQSVDLSTAGGTRTFPCTYEGCNRVFDQVHKLK